MNWLVVRGWFCSSSVESIVSPVSESTEGALRICSQTFLASSSQFGSDEADATWVPPDDGLPPDCEAHAENSKSIMKPATSADNLMFIDPLDREQLGCAGCAGVLYTSGGRICQQLFPAPEDHFAAAHVCDFLDVEAVAPQNVGQHRPGVLRNVLLEITARDHMAVDRLDSAPRPRCVV